MNEIMLGYLRHGVTSQWKKDYNHKYYLANKEKWATYYNPTRESIKSDVKNTKRMIKALSTEASSTWKKEKKKLKDAAKKGRLEYDDTEAVYNPSTNMFDLVPVKRETMFNKRQYKEAMKEARREGRNAMQDIYYEAKRGIDGTTKEIIKNVKSQMKAVKTSDLSFGDKAKALAEGARVIAAAKAGQLSINMHLRVMKLKTLGFNPYGWG